MKPKCLLPSSHDHAPGPYAEPVESRPHCLLWLFYLHMGLVSVIYPLDIPTTFLYASLGSPVRATCPCYPIFREHPVLHTPNLTSKYAPVIRNIFLTRSFTLRTKKHFNILCD
jgi:hypothetical protein